MCPVALLDTARTFGYAAVVVAEGDHMFYRDGYAAAYATGFDSDDPERTGGGSAS